MTAKPDDIPQDVWDAADRALGYANSKAHMLAEPTDPLECISRAIMADRASRPSAIVEEPSGWKLVPVEPTEAMTDEACHQWINLHPGYPGEKPTPTAGEVADTIYRAMLAAVPPSPQPHTGRADHIGDANEMIDKISSALGRLSWYDDAEHRRTPDEMFAFLVDRVAALNAALTVEPEADEPTPEMIEAFDRGFKRQIGLRHAERFKPQASARGARSAEEVGLRAMLLAKHGTPPIEAAEAAFAKVAP